MVVLQATPESEAGQVAKAPPPPLYCAATCRTSGGECSASHFCCFQKRKCDASEEFTTSTLWMLDWYSWLMRWSTRSEPERSTSTSIFGYCALNILATSSATFTSTDAYHTTFTSFSAAATLAGVVSWAKSGVESAATKARNNVFLMSSSSLLCVLQRTRPLNRSARMRTPTFEPDGTSTAGGAVTSTSCPISTM